MSSILGVIMEKVCMLSPKITYFVSARWVIFSSVYSEYMFEEFKQTIFKGRQG